MLIPHCNWCLKRWLVTIIGYAAVSLAASAQPGMPAGDPPSPATRLAPTAEASAKPNSASAGMTVYIDPVTGKFMNEPSAGQTPLTLSPKLRNALSTSHEGLYEIQNPIPGGGVMLNLQGRFQSPLVGTVDSAGKSKIQHLPMDAVNPGSVTQQDVQKSKP